MYKYDKGDKFVVEVKLAYSNAIGAAYDMGVVTLNERQLDMLEKLDCDYVNEHFEDLQDFAYEKGKEDAWKLAGRISGPVSDNLSENNLLKIFGFKQRSQIYEKYTVNQAMALIGQYEKDEKIKAGDIVMTEDEAAVVTAIEDQYYHLVLLRSGRVVKADKDYGYVKCKTGRMTDICSLLKEAAGADKEDKA